MDIDDDDDYNSSGSEGKESGQSSENDCYSDSLDSNGPAHTSSKSQQKGHFSAQKGREQQVAVVRGVEATTSRSQVASDPLPQTPGGFEFLKLESYICHCSSQPTFELHPASQELSSLAQAPGSCKVLAYFGLVFLNALQAVFCPAHNRIVPMSEWATHIRYRHLDWCSSTKKIDCTQMAKHVADSHSLSIDQTSVDLNLPHEIEEPLSDQGSSYINLNYKCPLGCGTWIAADKGSNFPERFIREKHIRYSCPNGLCPQFKDIDIGEPHWIHKVKISRAHTDQYHCFVLPHGWDAMGSGTLATVPDGPHLGNPSGLAVLGDQQDWPLLLGWVGYDQEISAGDYVTALRSLIKLPRCNCKRTSQTSHLHFLDKGLHLVHHALVKYFKTAMLFIHQKHQTVVNAITSRCVLCLFEW